MSATNFDAVMEEVFLHEGGYVNHKKDPGGETNYGISKRSYPNLNIRALTKADAKTIYRKDFWEPIRGDELPTGIDLVTMDPSVNSGRKRGVSWLQHALGVVVDGQMGPATVAAARKAEPAGVISRACAKRSGWLRGLRTWGTFGKGWARRVAEVEAAAIRMANPYALGKTLTAARKSAEKEDKKAGGTVVGTAGGGAGLEANDSLGDLMAHPWAPYLIGAVLLLLLAQFIGGRMYHRIRMDALLKEIDNA